MKNYLELLAAFLIAPMFGNAGFVSASAADLKPNIVFILTDDQGYGDLGCYGSMNNEITGIIDMLPTFCALAEVDVPSDRVIDGRNIFPYMRGEDETLTSPNFTA